MKTDAADASAAPLPAPLALPYGLYAGLLFVCLSLLTLLALLLLPSLAWRRRVARAMARGWMALAGLRLGVRGLAQLPDGNCVVVANHASYLDGVVLTAVLPPRFSFVIKREMDGVPLAGLLLRRIGAQFVDRANRHRGGSDARRVLRAASRGQSLAFFPEGTFSQQPGLLGFHAGAFVTAARADLPVVPLIIEGTRAALPATRALPQPARIRVELLPPLLPRDFAAADAATQLRLRARSAMLRRLGEPDLAPAESDDSR